MAANSRPESVVSKERMPTNPPTPDSPKPPRVFPPRRDFMSLAVEDLLEARDANQVALSAMRNVVATAIGRYLIHQDDWYANHPPDVPRPANVKRIPADTPDNPRTCATHGGQAPQVKKSARERLAELVEPALEGLHTALKSGEIPSIVKAAQIVLDRTGFHPSKAIELTGEFVGPVEVVSAERLDR